MSYIIYILMNDENQNSEIDIDKEIMMGMLYDSMNGMDYLMQQYGDGEDEEVNNNEFVEPENLNQSEDLMNILDEELSNIGESMQNNVHSNVNNQENNGNENMVFDDEFDNDDNYDDMPELIEEDSQSNFYYPQTNTNYAPINFNNLGNTFFTVSSYSFPQESFNINSNTNINASLIYTRLSNTLSNSININNTYSYSFFSNNQSNINFQNLNTYSNFVNINNISTDSNNSLLNTVRTLLNTTFNNFQTVFNGENIFDTSDVIVTLNKDSLDNLESIKYKDIQNDNKMSKCTICLEEFEDDDENIVLKCNHNYHANCIKEWLSKHSYKCPICRIEVGDSEAQLNQST